MSKAAREYCPKCQSVLKLKGDDAGNGTYFCVGEDCDYERKAEKSPIAEAVATELTPKTLIKLDIGCGPNPKEGYEGVDMYSFGGKVKHVFDLRQKNWPFASDSVDAIHCSHFIEHLTNLDDRWERINFFNQCYRIMVKGAPLTLIFPHWCSNRYYGDPTHKEPFAEMGFLYLDKNWRVPNAPHTDISVNPDGYNCNWQYNVGYSMHPELINRSVEVQRFWMQWYKDACQDMLATLYPIKE